MIFQLKNRDVLYEEVKRRLESKSIRFNTELLSQFIEFKVNGVNQVKNPKKPIPTKTEVDIETVRRWVADFVRIYCSQHNT